MARTETPTGGSFAAIALHLALGIAGFAGAGALLERLLPELEVPDVSSKLRAIRAASPHYDVLLVGNSRIYYQLDPAAFDVAVREAGGPEVHSYNLGANGMSVFETHFLLRTLLADPSTRPRAVVWDLAIRPCPPQRDRGTMRFAYWHGLEETRRAIAYELGDAVALAVRMDRVGKHLGAFADRAIQRGRLADHLLGDRAPSAPPAFDGRGYVAMRDDVNNPGAEENRRQFLAAVAKGAWPQPRRMRDATPREGAIVDWVVALLDRHGVTPILMVSPIGDDVSSPLGSRKAEVLGHPVHRFDTASEHPELHEPSAFYDATHLDREGGRLLVKALAGLAVPEQLVPPSSAPERPLGGR